MRDFFLKDSILKIISFVVALLLWFYIIAVIDPSVDVTVKDIPIRYTNEQLVLDKGLCLVSDDDLAVELKIRGSRKRIANIENKNIYATVDLANISKTGTFSLPIAISIPYEYDEIVNKKPYNANVFIDKVVSVNREVKVLTSGSTANGYIAGVPSSNVTTVKLTGASTMIDTISGVGAELDFDGRAADINDTVKLVFLDKNGKKISKNSKVYDLVKMDTETVDIECKVYKQKSVSVKVNARANGGIDRYKVSVQPEHVTIYAENDVLETIDELTTKPVNLDEITTGSTTVEIEIPKGVFLRDGVDAVTVKAEKRS